MKYMLYDSDNLIRETFATKEDAYDYMNKWVADSGFKSYYIRQNFVTDTKIMIDYGSHTHFFYLDFTNKL